MSRRSGTIAQMSDGRKIIIFNDQPLLKDKKKVVVYLINEDYELIIDNGEPKTLLFDLKVYNEAAKTWTAIGKVD